MKRIIPLFAFLLSGIVSAQNLVPNGDFEQHGGCDFTVGVIDSAAYWMNPSFDPFGTPDYFNQCNPSPSISVPSNVRGWQNAHSGVAYSGIVIARKVTNPEYREFIEVPLTSTLVLNGSYHFEMYMSLGDQSEYTSDAVQAYFSDTAVTGVSNPYPLPFTPQISNTPGNFPDATNWTLVSGDYTANGTERYLIIGNFHDSFSTTATVASGTLTYFAYIFIDDVSLVPVNVATTVNNVSEEQPVQISPNPSNGAVNIVFSKPPENASIAIYNSTGSLVYSKQSTNEVNTVDLSDQASGIYFIKVMSNNRIMTSQKIIKQ